MLHQLYCLWESARPPHNTASKGGGELPLHFPCGKRTEKHAGSQPVCRPDGVKLRGTGNGRISQWRKSIHTSRAYHAVISKTAASFLCIHKNNHLRFYHLLNLYILMLNCFAEWVERWALSKCKGCRFKSRQGWSDN